MKKVLVALFVFAFGQSIANEVSTPLEGFSQLYEARFGEVENCGSETTFRVCAERLRNEGNAPFIMHHGEKTEKVAVLFHGLSDSPYYMQPIAQSLYDMGLNVVVALSPGHGIKDAGDAMLAPNLSDQWIQHVEDVMALAPELGDKIIIGGFSTGGALATQHSLANPDNISGLMLFSGALALSGNTESLAKIWGVKWLAKLLDGEFESEGPNPYKYGYIANSSGLELMEVIADIRETLDQGNTIRVPIFAVHSESDITTPIEGVQGLLDASEGENTVFFISNKHDVCHADVVLNYAHAKAIKIDEDKVNALESCSLPKANPVYRQMTNLLRIYISGV